MVAIWNKGLQSSSEWYSRKVMWLLEQKNNERNNYVTYSNFSLNCADLYLEYIKIINKCLILLIVKWSEFWTFKLVLFRFTKQKRTAVNHLSKCIWLDMTYQSEQTNNICRNLLHYDKNWYLMCENLVLPFNVLGFVRTPRNGAILDSNPRSDH